MQYYLKIVRKGYKTMPGILGLVTFALLILAGLFAFVLLVYEPANDWHTTTFTLSRYEYQYSRGVGVLDLYTTDGRRYVLNQNEETIRYQLKEGQQYNAVYSDDFFHDIIKGLSDTEGEYLNADEMRKSHTTERLWFSILLVVCILILLISNSVYAIFCIRTEEEKRRKRINKRK
jgi:hypothetical protein